MPILYKFITAFLALTGCISLVITGEINPIMSVSGIALLPGYYRFFKGDDPAPKQVVGLLAGMTFLVFLFDATVISGDIFLAVAHLTIIFQAVKSFDLKEPWDHLQVYFMSLLQLIIASELTMSLAFGIIFIFFMIMLVTAMIFSHYLKEGVVRTAEVLKPVVLISVLTMVTTIIFFLVLPRTTQKFLGRSYARGIQTAGFSEKVDFGSFGAVKLDQTVVMRIEMITDVGVPLYWRGLSLDYFDGMSWKNSSKDRKRIVSSDEMYMIVPFDRDTSTEQKVFLEPIDSDVIFGLEYVSGVRADSYSMMVDDGMSVFVSRRTPRRIAYTAFSSRQNALSEGADRKFLQMPQEGIRRIRNHALKITSEAKTAFGKASAIERYLKHNYAYSLTTSAPPAGVSPVEDFLFNTKKGYCEHYATSMVLMLRSLGIPSRIVNGFFGGEKNEYGGYIIVRQSNAHSWVEAFIAGAWKRFDPTPSVFVGRPSSAGLFLDSIVLLWSRYVIGFSSSDQRDIIEGLVLRLSFEKIINTAEGDAGRAPLALICFLAVLIVMIVFIVRRKESRKYDHITSKYVAFRNLLKKKGIITSSSVTPGEIREKTAGWCSGADVHEFVNIYEEHRFGRKKLSHEKVKRYASLLKKIQKSS